MSTTVFSMDRTTIETETTNTLRYIETELGKLPTLKSRREIQFVAEEVGKAVAYLGDMVEAAKEALGASHKITLETIAERDEAQRAYDEVTRAIQNVNRDHPLVGELVEIVEEGIDDRLADQAYETKQKTIKEIDAKAYDAAKENVRNEIIHTLLNVVGVDFPDAVRLLALLTEGDTAGIADKRLQALREAIEQLGMK